ncbi:MAG: anti-sigma factor family protein [Phycisphaerales bacterium]
MERFNCDDIAAVLSGLIDDEVDQETRRLAEAHLSHCAECRRTLDEFEGLDSLVDATVASEESWPESLERRIWAEVFDRDAHEARTRRWRLVAVSGWMVAVAAMFIAGFVFMLGPSVDLIDRTGPEFATNDASPDVGVEPRVDETGAEETPTPPLVVALNESDNSVDAVDPASVLRLARHSVARLDEQLNRWTSFTRGAADQGAEWLEVIDWSAADVTRSRANPSSEAMAAWTLVDFDELRRESMAMDDASDDAEMNATAVEGPRRSIDAGRQPEYLAAAEWWNPIEPADVIYEASVILSVLKAADTDSYADVYTLGRVLESDDVLERLADMKQALDDPDDAAVVGQAWSTLEWMSGPVDQQELRSVQQMIEETDLPQRLEGLTERLTAED